MNSDLCKKDATFRDAIFLEVQVGAFLIWIGGRTYWLYQPNLELAVLLFVKLYDPWN